MKAKKQNKPKAKKQPEQKEDLTVEMDSGRSERPNLVTVERFNLRGKCFFSLINERSGIFEIEIRKKSVDEIKKAVIDLRDLLR